MLEWLTCVLQKSDEVVEDAKAAAPGVAHESSSSERLPEKLGNSEDYSEDDSEDDSEKDSENDFEKNCENDSA